jgi:hypothetical protein
LEQQIAAGLAGTGLEQADHAETLAVRPNVVSSATANALTSGNRRLVSIRTSGLKSNGAPALKL